MISNIILLYRTYPKMGYWAATSSKYFTRWNLFVIWQAIELIQHQLWKHSDIQTKHKITCGENQRTLFQLGFIKMKTKSVANISRSQADQESKKEDYRGTYESITPWWHALVRDSKRDMQLWWIYWFTPLVKHTVNNSLLLTYFDCPVLFVFLLD